ncbi:flagellar hook-associated protein FlgK [Bradyrhizobium paxllaeri]|uniref:flagellar hook-associated protein FlgK n=1 Tax=Bradyrhizobium paxllaeri TaxID=190148 RepID=UPI000810ABA0|nr:flagellar hook-associated protein FlgK [Bradyrhizobium paxllaeri]
MLTNAFSTAAAGLQATQKAIGIVSQNVANAGAAGYVRRTVTTLAPGPGNSGVAVASASRIFEEAALKQLRSETSGAAYSSSKADVLSQIDRLFGKPGDSAALDGRLNAFTQTLQGLAANPASVAMRSTVLNAASVLSEQIRDIASNVQGLRSGIENRLAADVRTANGLLSSIANLNVKIAAASDDSDRASLVDQRDQKVTQLSSFLDVHGVQQRDGAVTLMTTSGVALVDRGAATELSFDNRGTLGPTSTYSTNLSLRGVGTISATMPGGSVIDLGSRGALRSGSIAAGLELRDTALPQVQRQLDDLAFGLAQSLTDKNTIATQGGAGFDLNVNELANIKPGNTITIPISSGGSVRNVILVASALGSKPVDATQTIDSHALVRTFTIPPAPAASQDYTKAISAALSVVAANVTVTSTTQGRVTFSGPGIQSVIAMITQPKSENDLSGAHPRIPLFVDGSDNTLVTGSLDDGSQRIGLAQRFSVNRALAADSSVLTRASDAGASPNPSRPQFVYDALTSTRQTFSSASGIGGTQIPRIATVASFAQDVIVAQGTAAAVATKMNEGQSIVLAAAQGRFASSASVKVDDEMSRLLALQTAYSANARVLTAVKEMLDLLLRS